MSREYLSKSALRCLSAAAATASFISFQPLPLEMDSLSKVVEAKEGTLNPKIYSGQGSSAAAGFPLKLRQVHVFFRHGDRSPITIPSSALSAQDSKLWESRLQTPSKWMEHRVYTNGNDNPYGQLTKKGALQARELGQTLRHRYGDLLGLLNEHGDIDVSDSLYVRSTDFRRTHMTGFYVLTGLLGSESSAGKVKFEIRAPLQETLCVHTELCPSLVRWWKEAWKAACKISKLQSGDIMEGGWRAQHQREKQILADYLGIESSGKFPWMTAIDYMDCREAHGDPLPKGLSSGQLRILRKLILEDHYESVKVPELWQFFTGRMATELYQDIKTTVDDSGKTESWIPRIVLYSGHDITLLPLAACLGIQMEWWPPYASVLCLEIWSTIDGRSHFVRALYNWEEMSLIDGAAAAAAAAAGGGNASTGTTNVANRAMAAMARKSMGVTPSSSPTPASASTLVTWNAFSKLLQPHILKTVDFQQLCDSLSAARPK